MPHWWRQQWKRRGMNMKISKMMTLTKSVSTYFRNRCGSPLVSRQHNAQRILTDCRTWLGWRLLCTQISRLKQFHACEKLDIGLDFVRNANSWNFEVEVTSSTGRLKQVPYMYERVLIFLEKPNQRTQKENLQKSPSYNKMTLAFLLYCNFVNKFHKWDQTPKIHNNRFLVFLRRYLMSA